jgi:hypothetical protein
MQKSIALINAISNINLGASCWQNALLTERNSSQLLSEDFGVCDLHTAISKLQFDIERSIGVDDWRHDYEKMTRTLVIALLGLRVVIAKLAKKCSVTSSIGISDAAIEIYRDKGIEETHRFIESKLAEQQYLESLRNIFSNILILFFPGPLGIDEATATRYETAVHRNFNDAAKLAHKWATAFDLTASHLSKFPSIYLDVIDIQIERANELVWEVLPERTNDHAVQGMILFAECIPTIIELYDQGMFNTKNIQTLFKSLS